MLTPTVSATTSANGGQATPINNDLGQKDIFLKLLVAQMKNQNPEKPNDPTQMASQLAQFNMVDQQTQSTKLLQQLVDVMGSSQSSSSGVSASYLGKNVTVEQNQMNFNGTTQNFAAVTKFPAAEAQVTILDNTGAVVRSMNFTNLPAGANSLSWDGMTDSGAGAVQGTYSINVQAKDSHGVSVPTVIERSGIVDAVRLSAAGNTVMVGGISSDQSKITEIRL
ncbi:MAG: FlgD immunoglobulin-like domain containing protein [Mariprofundus sp.]|nr:FlgD immunoglobulin-like domain containing protein [Mariprofundus sp.]